MSNHLGVLIARVHHLQHRYVHPRLERLGLFRGQPPVLMRIGSGITQHELAEQVNLRPPTLTRILTRLEQRGLVERTVGADDQRTKVVRLTHQGDAMVNKVRDVMHEENQLIFSVLSEGERQQLAALLNRVAERYSEFSEADYQEHSR